MAGIKMGDQVLQLGCRDPGMLAALALQVGLSGQACAVAETEEAASRVRKAAAKAGTLVDIQVAPFHDLPYADALFNLVILREVIASMRPYDRAACLQDVRRVLAGGGRCLIIEWAERAWDRMPTPRWEVELAHAGGDVRRICWRYAPGRAPMESPAERVK